MKLNTLTAHPLISLTIVSLFPQKIYEVIILIIKWKKKAYKEFN